MVEELAQGNHVVGRILKAGMDFKAGKLPRTMVPRLAKRVLLTLPHSSLGWLDLSQFSILSLTT